MMDPFHTHRRVIAPLASWKDFYTDFIIIYLFIIFIYLYLYIYYLFIYLLYYLLLKKSLFSFVMNTLDW